MNDDPKIPKDTPSRASTMRPPPPATTASIPAAPPSPSVRAPRPSKARGGGARIEGLVPNDLPTPRSTVIPRLPSTGASLGKMRPQLETLIFHGAPPPPPPSPAKLLVAPPTASERALASGLDEAFQDVQSVELLDDPDDEGESGHEAARESERATPYREPHAARTGRPPPASLAARRHGPREARFLGAVAGAVAIPVALALVLERPSRAPVAPHPRSSVAATASPKPGPVTRAAGTCNVQGASRLLARRALVRGGVEATALGDRVAFATMTTPRSGTAFELDARTLDVKGSAKVVTGDLLRHVVPELDDAAPVEAQADTTTFRTLADAEGESAVGVRDGFVVWGPRDGDGMVRLWKLAWGQTMDAPRVAGLGTGGDRVMAVRRTGAIAGAAGVNGIWIGTFRGGQTTSELTRLSTSALVGVPSLDVRGDEAIVAWAQRDGATTPWGVRWARWAPGAAAGVVHALELPPGGPGDRAMAPSVSALDGGRFLLAWTEAGHGRNQVRAQVFDASDRPLGDTMAVSPEDAVAGQEQIALADGGHGAIAYLVAKRGSFELRASALDCAAP